MTRSSRGFGLIELLVALALSLVVVLGVAQIFIAAKNTYVSQNTAANMQEDARFVLSKLIQEIRMVGMFGCLNTVTDASSAGDFAASKSSPISWDNTNKKLTLVTADIVRSDGVVTGGVPTWTVVSECRASTAVGFGTAYSGSRLPAPGQIAFPIRRLIYSFKNNQLTLGSGSGTPAQYVLVDNVSVFDVSFGVAADEKTAETSSYSNNPDTNLIRSVRITLTLSDPSRRVRDQTFNVVAALRNRLP